MLALLFITSLLWGLVWGLVLISKQKEKDFLHRTDGNHTMLVHPHTGQGEEWKTHLKTQKSALFCRCVPNPEQQQQGGSDALSGHPGEPEAGPAPPGSFLGSSSAGEAVQGCAVLRARGWHSPCPGQDSIFHCVPHPHRSPRARGCPCVGIDRDHEDGPGAVPCSGLSL